MSIDVPKHTKYLFLHSQFCVVPPPHKFLLHPHYRMETNSQYLRFWCSVLVSIEPHPEYIDPGSCKFQGLRKRGGCIWGGVFHF